MQNQFIGPSGRELAPRRKEKRSYPLAPAEEQRRSIAESRDTHGLLANGGKAVIDEGSDLLRAPVAVEKALGNSLSLAAVPPRIEFAIIPYDRRYFSAADADHQVGPWSSWGQACYHAASDTFFGAVGDHGWYDPNLHLIEYSPESRVASCLPEINTVLGRPADQFGEAKIHGYPDVYRAPYLESDHLWFCTYWCRYPEPLEHDFATGYTGGHIMSYDLKKGTFVDYGVPLVRASWPYHRIDHARGLLYGLGMFGEFLVWDIGRQEALWAGYPPPDMKWFNRCLMIDNVNGGVYSNNMLSDTRRLIKYDPDRNRFAELDIDMPVDKRNNQAVVMRAHTRKRGPDGRIWGLTSVGNLFSFDPDSEKMEIRERLWPLNDAYTVTMDQSPGGRYLYFGIGSHGRGYPYGSPILQHDVQTGTTRILAFLHPYYYEKYGYVAGGSYSFKLDDAGERLFMIWNGDFTDLSRLDRERQAYDADDIKNWSAPSPHDAFGHCAVFVLHIPSEVRAE